jgi:outer membrane protein OmpA-like peptidoglycan-associated protein
MRRIKRNKYTFENQFRKALHTTTSIINYYSPDQLKAKLEEFVKYYNFKRYHESLQNLTPSDVYFGQAEKKLKQRKMIKIKTLNERKKQYQENQVHCVKHSLNFYPKKFSFV